MLRRIFRKLFKKKKKRDQGRHGQNSFQEAMYSIYLTNWIKENDPKNYNRMVEEAEEEEREEENGRKGKMGYAKSVLFERMLWSPQGEKLLEDISGMYHMPKSIIPEFKIIAYKEGLIIDFDDLCNDSGVRCYDDEGNVTDMDGNIKQTKVSRDSFSNRKWIFNKLEKMNLEELIEVLEFIKAKETAKEGEE